MIFIGIDKAKDKHDCFIVKSEAKCYLMYSLSLTLSVVFMTCFLKLSLFHQI